MKKITDERLVLRNLQHIKIAYIVQTVGILAILCYELIVGGLDGMRQNPLWAVFMITTIVYAYLTMSVSVEHETSIKNPKKSFYISLIVLLLISFGIAYFTSITPNFNWGNGLVVGAIISVCGFIPIFYIYKLRLKQANDLDEN
ncbi:hypothetical protein ACWE42_06250 [Sutcliffiella cohnii]|uniref:Branched-chain amino acid ABC transporter substrate-binding protein n=1 Tax=Sutcliffiella cohnii TaxID=33932 RepID=A0A223KQA2_9BACI|nr:MULTISPECIES: hypothetical protein [Sutcliffiella]AST91513.1 hypothetical protein BC6307_09575 [Sutcliffiella cohnii]MED4014919.1 hypothetical protein [Sutcliffiella cohnii]WBL17345.1 hypothetical protein O1A01_12215 [Sutcliffiella sp. NC1]